ncbi:hypothetical protein [Bacillus sp. ISL-4]|uniref:hypothetical protein n=1 Tax=Bacillus sp. ISL-4 TaxID=2819125 RepID=UPI002570A5F9|nr:hypothetical protein [Bacillus sp. ISL-4]
MPKGMRPTEVTRKLGFFVQSVYKYIQEGAIKAKVVPFGDGRTIYVISETAYEEADGLLKPSETQRPKRFEYYQSRQDIVLFQKFHSSKVPKARVIQLWNFI